MPEELYLTVIMTIIMTIVIAIVIAIKDARYEDKSDTAR
jgi:hypothetical protein